MYCNSLGLTWFRKFYLAKFPMYDKPNLWLVDLCQHVVRHNSVIIRKLSIRELSELWQSYDSFICASRVHRLVVILKDLACEHSELWQTVDTWICASISSVIGLWKCWPFSVVCLRAQTNLWRIDLRQHFVMELVYVCSGIVHQIFARTSKHYRS